MSIAKAIATDDRAWELLNNAFLWRGWAALNDSLQSGQTANSIIELADYLGESGVADLDSYT